MLETGIRTGDTVHPMLEGTGLYRTIRFAAKQMPQQAIAKRAKADIVVITACGERANEVEIWV